MTISKQKNIIVNAEFEGRRFLAFGSSFDECITAVEFFPDSDVEVTIVHYADELEFIEHTTWHTWIMAGIKNKLFAEKLKTYQLINK